MDIKVIRFFNEILGWKLPGVINPPIFLYVDLKPSSKVHTLSDFHYLDKKDFVI
jgi:hypothetical protein